MQMAENNNVKFKFKPRRKRREVLTPTQRTTMLWNHYLKWKNTDPKLRGLWTNYKRLGKFPDESEIG